MIVAVRGNGPYHIAWIHDPSLSKKTDDPYIYINLYINPGQSPYKEEKEGGRGAEAPSPFSLVSTPKKSGFVSLI